MNTDAILFVLVLVSPGAIAYLLRKTPFWWLMSTVLGVLGVLCFCSLEPVHSGEMFADLGNWLLELAGGFCLVYGAIILAVLLVMRNIRSQPKPPRLPPARIV
ncbi:MAG TPA: hypothetical protein VGM88_31340 [Kofleriaceae bacterium]|jgi:hypothetical protein